MKCLFCMIAMLMLAPVSLGFVNLATDVPRAIELMQDKKWAEAHAKLNDVVVQFGERGEALFGSKFGEIYYLKGYCELNMAKSFDDEIRKKEWFHIASNSMGECFEVNMRAGKVHSKSLLYKAEAEQGAGNPAGAIELYKMFKSLQPKE